MNEQNSPTLTKTPFYYERLYKIYKYITVSLAALTCAIGALAFILCTDETSNYLSPSPLTTVFYAVLVLDVILAISALFLFKNTKKISSKSKIVRFFSLFPAAAATYALVTVSTSAERGVVDILLMIAATLTVLFCISRIVDLPDVVSVCSGYGQATFGILIVVRTYIDSSLEMNAPVKLLIQFAAIFTSFSVLSDIRHILGRNNAVAFAAFKALTVCLCPVTIFAVSALSKIGAEYTCYSIFLVAYAVYQLTTLISAAVEYHYYYEDLDECYVPAEEEE